MTDQYSQQCVNNMFSCGNPHKVRKICLNLSEDLLENNTSSESSTDPSLENTWWWWWRWWCLPSSLLLSWLQALEQRNKSFCFAFKKTRLCLLSWEAPGAKHQRRGSGRMIAADRAVCRPLMTLSEQIKLWMINLDTESMRAVGFIRASLTSEAFIRWGGTFVKGVPAFGKKLIGKCHSQHLVL